MAMDFSTSSMRRSSVKLVGGAVFSLLLLSMFAPGNTAQSSETQATGVKAGNAAAPAATEALSASQPAESATTHSGSSLRLEAGDLVEVGVYNVPELTTKARVSS